MADDTCGHEGCTCAPREDGYCSDYCARHGGEGHEPHACACGHSTCEADPAT